MSAKKEKLLNELLITNLTADELYELKVLAGTRSIHDPNHVYRSEASQTFRVVLRANCESKYCHDWNSALRATWRLVDESQNLKDCPPDGAPSRPQGVGRDRFWVGGRAH